MEKTVRLYLRAGIENVNAELELSTLTRQGSALITSAATSMLSKGNSFQRIIDYFPCEYVHVCAYQMAKTMKSLLRFEANEVVQPM
jgi:hypothetical protein